MLQHIGTNQTVYETITFYVLSTQNAPAFVWVGSEPSGQKKRVFFFVFFCFFFFDFFVGVLF